MELNQLLINYFQGVKSLSGKDHYKALCPCHNDHNPSLDIILKDNKILMACPVCGADGKKVMQTLGLDVKELFYEQRSNKPIKKPDSVDYMYSKTLKKSRYYVWKDKKQRYEKKFCWWHKKGGKWEKGANKEEPPLYKQSNIKQAIDNKKILYIAEGEKDVDTLTNKLGLYAVCSPHGAGHDKGKLEKKWRDSFNRLFDGAEVAIIPDNDKPGKSLSAYIAVQIQPFAKSVKVLDLAKEWDNLKPKSDITDIYESTAPLPNKRIADIVRDKLEALALTTDEYTAQYINNTNELTLPEFTYNDIKQHKADDIGTAEFFCELVKDFLCYVPEEKAFYFYNGIKWEQDIVKENLRTGKLLMEFVSTAQKLIPQPGESKSESINKAYRSHYHTLGNSNGRDRIIKDIKKILIKSRNSFDTQPHLINCLNCTYNLETEKQQKHSAADLLTKCMNAEYIPNAENKRFNRFIDEICNGDQEQKTALQNNLGYTIFGGTPEECCFFAYGKSTRNGKGTLFDLVLDVLGNYGVQMDFNTIARTKTKDASRATPDLARLVGVRYVLANEPQKGTCINEALLKQLTGSDDITARSLYGSTFQFKPIFTLYVTTNNLPSISDDTLFTSGRIRIIPFNRHFSESERDVNLKRTLREGNGRKAVLKWLIDGYMMYKRDRLKTTADGENILKQYQKDNDYIQQFIDEKLDIYNPSCINSRPTKLTVIQREYNDWCKVSNIRPLNKKHIIEELEKHGIPVIQYNKQYAARVGLKDNYSRDY